MDNEECVTCGKAFTPDNAEWFDGICELCFDELFAESEAVPTDTTNTAMQTTVIQQQDKQT